MFIQSTLTQPKVKPNKRVTPNNGSSNGNGWQKTLKFKDSITDGHTSGYGKRINKDAKGKKDKGLPALTPWKVILASFLIGICGIIYISHVFEMQNTLREVQQLENNYNKAKRLHAEKRLAYDRMVGPKEIYQNAREQGFINAGPADNILILKR
jgi:hypothetical protein